MTDENKYLDVSPTWQDGENTNFDEMTADALLNVDDTLEKNPKEQDVSNPYKMTEALLKDGNTFDNTGAYFHFKERFQLMGVSDDNERFHTDPDIYLFVTRNPDKKLELNCKWAKKTADGFNKTRGFNIDFLLDIGDEKDIKALNKKVSFSGGKNGNPASEGTYVAFVEHVTDLISGADCLEVFKDKDFEFPEPDDNDEADNDVETETKPQCFADYPPRVQHEALQILENGTLFEEMQKSVALTHYGHKTTRNALLLMEISVFVDDGAHGLLGGISGGGKTDLALTCALNFPAKNVYIISSNSPKDIFYDFESYDDEYNIVVFDDVLLNDELIKLIKLLTDNRVKEKVHKTVINGKAEKFKLKGKYEVIITYAKDLPDEELANRLFNIGVNIVDKGESKNGVKNKIRDNKQTKGNDNPLVQAIREPLRACVQYLIEHKTPVFNPYVSIYDPLNYNNRDINHLVSMTNARTFFDLNKRSTIRLNDETVITIGSLDDLQFVHDIWARDGDAQKFKLSELQKQCLDLLPEYTDKEAFDYVETLNNSLNVESRANRKAKLNKEPLLKSLARQLNVNPSTLKHALDRFNEGNKKSLLEIGLVDKIQLDEDNPKSPNFYYKIKLDDVSPVSSFEDVQKEKIDFAHAFESAIVKQTIIINLLIYANICLSERGGDTLKNYCEQDNVELNGNNYNDMINFLQGFFDTLDNDKDVIKHDDMTRDDMLKMFEFKEKLLKGSDEKTDTPPHTRVAQEICTCKASNENAQEDKQSNVECACTPVHIQDIFKSKIKEFLSKENVDMCIAQDTFDYLTRNGDGTLQDITNYISETVDPDDFNNETTPLKIAVHVEKLYLLDLLDFKGNRYELQPKFIDLVNAGGDDVEP